MKTQNFLHGEPLNPETEYACDMQAEADRWNEFMRPTLAKRFWDRVLVMFKRREWVANRADPTQVIEYRSRHLVLIGSWGVEAKLTLGRRTFRTYDARLAKWVFANLEDAFLRKDLLTEEDPMGRMEDYE